MPGALEPQKAARITRITASLSVGVALTLCVLKGWAWVASDSVSILSSLADSGLDLAASFFTLAAVTYAARPPDADHRYGHGKAEGLAALVQAGLVGVAATMIALEALPHFTEPRAITAGGPAIAVMIVSIVLSAGLVVAQTKAVRQTGSVATAGDRAHYISDLAANAAVIVGVAGAAYLGLPWLDPLVGVGVAGWLVYTAFDVARRGIDELLDKELDDEARDRIMSITLEKRDILGVHMLRTRAAGPQIHIQLHADLPAEISLKEAHTRIVAAERRLMAAFPGADIIIHADPAEGAEPHGAEAAWIKSEHAAEV